MSRSILNMFSANLSDKTGVYGFDSSNSAVSFIKFQNHIFTPPLDDIKELSRPIGRIYLGNSFLLHFGLNSNLNFKNSYLPVESSKIYKTNYVGFIIL
jgi:hypothetical protein